MNLRFLPKAATLLTGLLLAAPVFAHDYKLGALEIGHPWARATAPSVPNGGAFLTLKNTGATPDRLIAIETPVAARAELHTHIQDNGVMKMRRIDAIDLAANAEASLAPGGLHLMLLDLKEPLKRGKAFPVTLTFETAGKITVQVEVQGPGDTKPQHQDDHGHEHGEHGHGDHGDGDHGHDHH
jgi:copper(I)-binding protein